MQGLGYGILLGSTLVKVPQVVNVVRARSAGESVKKRLCWQRKPRVGKHSGKLFSQFSFQHSNT